MSRDLRQLWDSLPNKGLFAFTALAWTALFHWLGNSTLGYVPSNSMFVWTWALWQHGSDADNDDQMGMVVPFLVLGLLFYRRFELNSFTKKSWPPALALLALAVVLHVFGYLIQQTRVALVAYFLGLYALMGIFWGWTWLRQVAFPYILFAFCIPFSAYLEPMTFKLRLLSASLSVGIAQSLFHLPIERIGTMVFHPATATEAAFQFDVAAACSGIRSAAVVLLLTITFSFLFFNTWWRRLVIIASSPFLAVLGNVVRLVLTFVVADHSGQAAGKAIETKAGFVTFLVAVGGVVLLGKLLPKEASSLGEIPAENPPSFLEKNFGRPRLGLAAVAVAFMAGGFLWLGYLKSVVKLGAPGVKVVNAPIFTDSGALARTNSVFLPSIVSGFKARTEPIQDLEVNYLPADTTYGRRSYASADGSMLARATVVLMGSDRTSIHRPEYCLTGFGWDILRSGMTKIPLADGTELEASKFQMVHAAPPGQKGQVSGIYVFWFVADGVRTANAVKRQWSLVRSMFSGAEVQRWAYISFFAACRPGEEEVTLEKLQKLIRLTQPEIEQGTLKTLTCRPPALISPGEMQKLSTGDLSRSGEWLASAPETIRKDNPWELGELAALKTMTP
ncbi:MAG TPA: exosortase/archaeosortase family protein [Candidatus Limnocylindria bacterium]|jgi:exosortase|nr:exosortase/archaeosortase family protein [Candidatus Limnocylindria bacterium]